MTKKNNTTQKIRAASVAIIVEIGWDGKKSVRKLAQLIKGTKSSVHRHLRAPKRRNRHPESVFWETEAGSAWMRLLVFVCGHIPIWIGMRCGCGEVVAVF
jgi:hypothetical protein